MNRSFRYALFTLLSVALTLLVIVLGITLLFVMFPRATGDFLGYTTAVSSRQAVAAIAQRPGAVLGISTDEVHAASAGSGVKVLRPVSDISLAIVEKISPESYLEVVQASPVQDSSDANSLFVLNDEGQEVLLSDISLESDQLHLADSKLVKNLNVQYLQGYVPGSGGNNLVVLNHDGNLALEGIVVSPSITSNSIVDGSVTNLDLANSTVALATGTTGTDINTSGSPVSLGGTLTLNIPTASATNRGALSASDFTTFNNKLSATLGSGLIFVGNASNVPVATALSGDATISNAGVLTIGTDAVTTGKILDGTVALADLSENSVNSSRIVDGSIANLDLANSTVALEVGDAGADVQAGTTPASLGGTLTLNIPTASAVNRGVLSPSDFTNFNNKLSATLGSGLIFIGNASSVPTAVALSGDATVTSAGELTVSSDAVTTGKILDGTIALADLASDSINSSKVVDGSVTNLDLANSTVALATGTTGTDINTSGSPVSLGGTLTLNIPTASATNRGALSASDFTTFNNKLSATLGSGLIFVGNASSVPVATALSGDATISNAGVLTIGADAVTTGKILDGTILGGDLAAGITISTSGNISTTGSGTITSAGAITANGGIATTSGNLTFQPAGTVTSANVQIGAGGLGSATPDLLTLDSKSNAGDPTGTNGAMYYNASTNKFRCYQNSAWADCITNPGSDSQSAASYDTSEAATNVASTQVTITSVSVTPSTATGDIYVRGKASLTSGSSTDQNLVFSIEDNATCTGSVIATSTINITSSSNTYVGEVEVSGVVVDAGASLKSYSLCAVTATGDTDVDVYQLIATVIDTGADVAEVYNTNDVDLEAGDVVSSDETLVTGVKKSQRAYDPSVLGIITTKPGLVIGGVDKEGVKALPVALSGRVPVKVSTENGEIKPGDYITSSSTKGVAMKATKAGSIIGTALAGYSGEGVGSVLVFVKNGASNGTSFSDALQGENGQAVLAQLMSKENNAQQLIDLSDVLADRVTAGIQLVTPQIFAGTITADLIKARRIEGLDVIATKLTTLSDHVDKLVASPSPSPIELTTINALIVKGDLSVRDSAEFKEKVAFENLVEFAHDVSFEKDTTFRGGVTFEGRPYFNKDTGGIAQIGQGDRRVEVMFEKEYDSAPLIQAMLTDAGEQEDAILNAGYAYIISSRSTKGFTIMLNKQAKDDLKFSWVAFAIKSGEAPEDEPADEVQVSESPTTSPSPEATAPLESPALTTTPAP